MVRTLMARGWLAETEGLLGKNRINTTSLPSSTTRASCTSVPGRVKEPRPGLMLKLLTMTLTVVLLTLTCIVSFRRNPPLGAAERICSVYFVAFVKSSYDLRTTRKGKV